MEANNDKCFKNLMSNKSLSLSSLRNKVFKPKNKTYEKSIKKTQRINIKLFVMKIEISLKVFGKIELYLNDNLEYVVKSFCTKFDLNEEAEEMLIEKLMIEKEKIFNEMNFVNNVKIRENRIVNIKNLKENGKIEIDKQKSLFYLQNN